MSQSAPDKSAPLPLGTLWEVPAKVSAKVSRPDGTEHTVLSDGKAAGYVLDAVGDFSAEADGKTHTVTAG